jgi:cystathionine gamma-synthase
LPIGVSGNATNPTLKMLHIERPVAAAKRVVTIVADNTFAKPLNQ